ncbi:glutaredoxin family protein [Tanacetum coccineum]
MGHGRIMAIMTRFLMDLGLDLTNKIEDINGPGRCGEDEARVVDNMNRMGDTADNVRGVGNNEIKPGKVKGRARAQLGASPAIHEVDHDAEMEWGLRRLGCNPAIPAVFVGGKYIGSAKDVISLHVDGTLKDKPIEARAICGRRGEDEARVVDNVNRMGDTADNVSRVVKILASKNAAVIFTKSTCCMCHSIKALFYELGASPAIHEVDHDAEMEWALRRLCCNPAIPAVFVGGKYIGSAKDVISLHVDGTLKDKLIEA